MSVRYGKAGQDAQLGAQSSVADTVRAGLIGGFVGAVTIWIYEAVVWVGAQHLMPLSAIPSNATGLVFGKNVQESLGPAAYILGTSPYLGLPLLACPQSGALKTFYFEG
jgi:hypothetical protein